MATGLRRANHDVAMARVSRYPIEELTAFNERMGWGVPYVSSLGGDFNFDFGVAYTEEEIANGAEQHAPQLGSLRHDFPKYEGVPSASDRPTDAAGMSAFALEDGVVYHTYSAYARGVDALWGMFQWLDRAPNGRNESDRWYRLNDEYDT